jgi:hypothetical protein
MNAFILFWDTSHLKGNKVDARLVEFPGWQNTAGLIGRVPLELPERIVFLANMKVVRNSDYPVNDCNWPLMSTEMRGVLSAVGPLPGHREIPVVMLDAKLPVTKQASAPGQYRPEAIDTRFAAVQLLEQTDAFDWEASVYVRHDELPNRVKRVQKLVLKEPPGGFPPLFRLSAYPSSLFVSAAARASLEGAGIKGPIYQTLDYI